MSQWRSVHSPNGKSECDNAFAEDKLEVENIPGLIYRTPQLNRQSDRNSALCRSSFLSFFEVIIGHSASEVSEYGTCIFLCFLCIH